MVPAEFQASPNAHYVCLLIQINDQNHRTKVALTKSALRLAIAIQHGRGASSRTLVSATDWLIFGWTKASRLPSPCCLPTQFNLAGGKIRCFLSFGSWRLWQLVTYCLTSLGFSLNMNGLTSQFGRLSGAVCGHALGSLASCRLADEAQAGLWQHGLRVILIWPAGRSTRRSASLKCRGSRSVRLSRRRKTIEIEIARSRSR